MAERACHAFASTTRFGLTQALGRYDRQSYFQFAVHCGWPSRRRRHFATTRICWVLGASPLAPCNCRQRHHASSCTTLVARNVRCLLGASCSWFGSTTPPASTPHRKFCSSPGRCSHVAHGFRMGYLRHRMGGRGLVSRGLTIHSSRTRFAGRLNSGVRPLTMTIQRHQAIEVARNFASSIPGAGYPIKPGHVSAELRDSDAFSKLLGVDCRHWAVTFEYSVPEGVVLSPDEIMVLVAETSGKATLATLM